MSKLYDFVKCLLQNLHINCFFGRCCAEPMATTNGNVAVVVEAAPAADDDVVVFDDGDKISDDVDGDVDDVDFVFFVLLLLLLVLLLLVETAVPVAVDNNP